MIFPAVAGERRAIRARVKDYTVFGAANAQSSGAYARRAPISQA